MPVSAMMSDLIKKQSWIRKMFEEGAKLKAQFGAENVFDFSLGNPDVPPPKEYFQVMRELAGDEKTPHGYMPNAGWPFVQEAVANYLSQEQGVPLKGGQVIMTVGAAGAINAAIKALFNPGEELISPSPYFVEYGGYAANHGGRLVPVPSSRDFRPDLAGIEAAITERTRAVLINSPHNPTGVVYTQAELSALADILERGGKKFNRRIYLMADEPYRQIVYDGLSVPSIFQLYPHSLIVSSYSKSLSLAGERIGYLAVHPAAEDSAEIVQAAVICHRLLGSVNAPSLSQLAVARLQGIKVDVTVYQRRRDLLCDGLAQLGYKFVRPQGAFYLFPESPIPDDVAFCNILKDENVLVVPGRGFGREGHFRISYAVPEETIRRSLPGFGRAMNKV